MFYHPVPKAMQQLLHFLSTHREALICAARLLGGPAAVRELSKLFQALSVPEPVITRQVAHDLITLHRLLSDESIGESLDLDRDHVLLIEPDDTTAAEISLLADEFGEHLAALTAEGLMQHRGLGGPGS